MEKFWNYIKFAKKHGIKRVFHLLCCFGFGGSIRYVNCISSLKEGKVDKTDLIEFRYKGILFSVRDNYTDLYLVQSILEGEKSEGGKYRGEYYYVEKAMMSLHEKSPIIIDAGANIGLFSIKILSLFPFARIKAYEVENENFVILSKNVSKLGVECNCRGVWYKTCCLKIIDRGTGAWGFRVEETDDDNTESVKSVSINDIIAQCDTEITLFKLDVEGSEYFIFKQESLDWVKKCKMVVIETHDNIIEGSDKIVNDVFEKMKFKKCVYGENQLFIRPDVYDKISEEMGI